MMTRLAGLPGWDDVVRERAARRLATRLERWWGSSTPITGTIHPEVLETKVASGDAAELMIVRAISTAVDDSEFGLTRTGAVYTTKPRGADDTDFHVFVAGLSSLLDGAAVLLRQQAGGRAAKFFESEGRFFTEDGTLFEFRIVADPPPWRKVLSAVQFWHSGSEPRFDPLFEVRGVPTLSPTASRSSGVGSETNDEPSKSGVQQQIHIDAPEPGVLQQMGYKVGKSGLAAATRREILHHVFIAELIPSAESRAYVAEWGPAGSRQRLGKMIRCLSAFIDMAQRRQGDLSVAIDEWEDDLHWLKRTYR